MKMSEDQKQDNNQPGEMTAKRREMSRRQFLSYTLGGTGGFMLSLPLIMNLRFAVDPLLQEKAGSDWVKVIEESEVTETPKSFAFQKEQIDGWYKSKPKFEAWIVRDSNGDIFALSPVCKHLGCTVNWSTNESYPNQYFCPCHGARYTKQGENLVVAPEPLDMYDVKIENGFVYLGQIKPNTIVQ